MPSIVGTSPSVTGTEQIILDPSAVATDRVEVDISAFISEVGVDWGDAAIEAYMAETSRGSVPIDYRIPNRVVEIPLKLADRPGMNFDTIRRALQAKVALFHARGGWVSRQTAIGTVYGDVVNATLTLSGDWLQSHRGIDVTAVMTLELLPDFYGAEITLDDKVETTAAELVTVLKQGGSNANIKGDYPGRVRIVVDEDQSVAQFGLMWGWRSWNYDSAATAALAYEAEALTPLDAATRTALTGASGGTAVFHGAVSATSWTPMLSTAHATSGALTHKGTYRVWTRVYSNSTPRVQLVWDVGAMNAVEENTAQAVPGAAAFYDVNLGEIRIDEAPVGTHAWAGQIQALAPASTCQLYIDKLWLVPVDEGYGVLRMSASSQAGVIAARDEFTGTTSGGALNARTPPVGAAWATSGAATDFAFVDAGGIATGIPPDEAASRSASGLRYAVLGAAMTDTQVVANFGGTASNGGGANGYVLARWTDANNYLALLAGLGNIGSDRINNFQLLKVVGGVQTSLAAAGGITYATLSASNPSIQLDLSVSAAGAITARFLSATGTVLRSETVVDTDLATGGALASGKSGIADWGLSGTTVRWYDNISVTTPPPPPAVINAGRSAELRTEGHYRQASSGTGYDKINAAIGDLPRIPVSGLEAKPVELFVKASRGDLDTVADSGIDDISARVTYRPSWLIIPGS